MKLKGLSRYDVTDTDGVVRLRSLTKGGYLRISEWNTFPVITDSGVGKSVSVGFIRFLIRHRELSVDDIHPAEQRIRFADDGTVLELYEAKTQKRQMKMFRDIDDVLATVLVMKAAASGDTTYLYRFIAEHREDALKLAGRRDRRFVRDLRDYLEEGEEDFIHKATSGNFSRITPLLVLFASCISNALMRGKAFERLGEKQQNISDTILYNALRERTED